MNMKHCVHANTRAVGFSSTVPLISISANRFVCRLFSIMYHPKPNAINPRVELQATAFTTNALKGKSSSSLDGDLFSSFKFN